MKFLLFVASAIAVAVAAPSKNVPVLPAGFEPIYDIAGNIIPEGIAVGPTIVGQDIVPIAVGPAIVPFPLPDGGEVVQEPVVPIDPYPVPVGEELVVDPYPVPVEAPAPVAPASSPLVQIIVNVNQAESSPVSVGAAPVKPDPVNVVDSAPVSPVIRPEPIVRPVPIPSEPVQIVEVAPVQEEPVQIGIPIIPNPAVVLPDELN